MRLGLQAATCKELDASSCGGFEVLVSRGIPKEVIGARMSYVEFHALRYGHWFMHASWRHKVVLTYSLRPAESIQAGSVANCCRRIFENV